MWSLVAVGQEWGHMWLLAVACVQQRNQKCGCWWLLRRHGGRNVVVDGCWQHWGHKWGCWWGLRSSCDAAVAEKLERSVRDKLKRLEFATFQLLSSFEELEGKT